MDLIFLFKNGSTTISTKKGEKKCIATAGSDISDINSTKVIGAFTQLNLALIVGDYKGNSGQAYLTSSPDITESRLQISPTIPSMLWVFFVVFFAVSGFILFVLEIAKFIFWGPRFLLKKEG